MDKTNGKELMGRVSIPILLANNSDVLQAEAGRINQDQIRRLEMTGVVDTDATHLVIPGWVPEKLGLQLQGEASVRYADHRTANRPIVRQVHVDLAGREGVFRTIVEPDRKDVLIGAIILEDLDFLVDCPRQRLVPRDPEHIVSEAE
ncbi:hypothetical protein HY256_00670 [Candidatus Sumerlaeota bacterium]|nr:hypothetical protein [Candidatus Sumerlaeota bacterium]